MHLLDFAYRDAFLSEYTADDLSSKLDTVDGKFYEQFVLYYNQQAKGHHNAECNDAFKKAVRMALSSNDHQLQYNNQSVSLPFYLISQRLPSMVNGLDLSASFLVGADKITTAYTSAAGIGGSKEEKAQKQAFLDSYLKSRKDYNQNSFEAELAGILLRAYRETTNIPKTKHETSAKPQCALIQEVLFRSLTLFVTKYSDSTRHELNSVKDFIKLIRRPQYDQDAVDIYNAIYRMVADRVAYSDAKKHEKQSLNYIQKLIARLPSAEHSFNGWPHCQVDCDEFYLFDEKLDRLNPNVDFTTIGISSPEQQRTMSKLDDFQTPWKKLLDHKRFQEDFLVKRFYFLHMGDKDRLLQCFRRFPCDLYFIEQLYDWLRSEQNKELNFIMKPETLDTSAAEERYRSRQLLLQSVSAKRDCWESYYHSSLDIPQSYFKKICLSESDQWSKLLSYHPFSKLNTLCKEFNMGSPLPGVHDSHLLPNSSIKLVTAERTVGEFEKLVNTEAYDMSEVKLTSKGLLPKTVRLGQSQQFTPMKKEDFQEYLAQLDPPLQDTEIWFDNQEYFSNALAKDYERLKAALATKRDTILNWKAYKKLLRLACHPDKRGNNPEYTALYDYISCHFEKNEKEGILSTYRVNDYVLYLYKVGHPISEIERSCGDPVWKAYDRNTAKYFSLAVKLVAYLEQISLPRLDIKEGGSEQEKLFDVQLRCLADLVLKVATMDKPKFMKDLVKFSLLSGNMHHVSSIINSNEYTYLQSSPVNDAIAQGFASAIEKLTELFASKKEIDGHDFDYDPFFSRACFILLWMTHDFAQSINENQFYSIIQSLDVDMQLFDLTKLFRLSSFDKPLKQMFSFFTQTMKHPGLYSSQYTLEAQGLQIDSGQTSTDYFDAFLGVYYCRIRGKFSENNLVDHRWSDFVRTLLFPKNPVQDGLKLSPAKLTYQAHVRLLEGLWKDQPENNSTSPSYKRIPFVLALLQSLNALRTIHEEDFNHLNGPQLLDDWSDKELLEKTLAAVRTWTLSGKRQAKALLAVPDKKPWWVIWKDGFELTRKTLRSHRKNLEQLFAHANRTSKITSSEHELIQAAIIYQMYANKPIAELLIQYHNTCINNKKPCQFVYFSLDLFKIPMTKIALSQEASTVLLKHIQPYFFDENNETYRLTPEFDELCVMVTYLSYVFSTSEKQKAEECVADLLGFCLVPQNARIYSYLKQSPNLLKLFQIENIIKNKNVLEKAAESVMHIHDHRPNFIKYAQELIQHLHDITGKDEITRQDATLLEDELRKLYLPFNTAKYIDFEKIIEEKERIYSLTQTLLASDAQGHSFYENFTKTLELCLIRNRPGSMPDLFYEHRFSGTWNADIALRRFVALEKGLREDKDDPIDLLCMPSWHSYAQKIFTYFFVYAKKPFGDLIHSHWTDDKRESFELANGIVEKKVICSTTKPKVNDYRPLYNLLERLSNSHEITIVSEVVAAMKSLTYSASSDTTINPYSFDLAFALMTKAQHVKLNESSPCLKLIRDLLSLVTVDRLLNVLMIYLHYDYQLSQLLQGVQSNSDISDHLSKKRLLYNHFPQFDEHDQLYQWTQTPLTFIRWLQKGSHPDYCKVLIRDQRFSEEYIDKTKKYLGFGYDLQGIEGLNNLVSGVLKPGNEDIWKKSQKIGPDLAYILCYLMPAVESQGHDTGNHIKSNWNNWVASRKKSIGNTPLAITNGCRSGCLELSSSDVFSSFLQAIPTFTRLTQLIQLKTKGKKKGTNIQAVTAIYKAIWTFCCSSEQPTTLHQF